MCGKPLDPCKSSKNVLLIVVVVAVVVAAAVVVSIVAAVLYSRRSNKTQPPSRIEPKNGCVPPYIDTSAETNPSPPSAQNRRVDAKLCFVRSDRTERFALHDLLRASAEVLGSGNFGSSYKAVLDSVPAVVVKKFRQMNGVRKDEFCQHMRKIGGLSHRNLLPMLAFYYRKEEKLLISDFVSNGSLASHLHSKCRSTLTLLDRKTRMGSTNTKKPGPKNLA